MGLERIPASDLGKLQEIRIVQKLGETYQLSEQERPTRLYVSSQGGGIRTPWKIMPYLLYVRLSMAIP